MHVTTLLLDLLYWACCTTTVFRREVDGRVEGLLVGLIFRELDISQLYGCRLEDLARVRNATERGGSLP